MAHFNIYHAAINEFHQLYDDLIGALTGSLVDLGHTCTVTRNGIVIDAINIIVGSTIFASRYQALAQKLNGVPYIVYQLEQLDDQHGLLSEWKEYWDLLKNAKFIWDYDPVSTEYLKAKGLSNVLHVPPNFHRSLESFRPVAHPDIDVLFFGSSHERRERILEALKQKGVSVVNLGSMFGSQRNSYIARAKVVLNIHAWSDFNQLETVRLSHLLANRSFVISETSAQNPYADGVIFRPYDGLVDACVQFLQQPQAVRDQVAAQGYLNARKLDMVSLLNMTLEKMGPQVLAQCVSTVGSSLENYFARHRPDVLAMVSTQAKRILDIGCAGGYLGADIKQRQNCHVTGIELDPVAANHAAKLLDLCICGNAFDVVPKLANNSYDTVMLLDVLEHVVDTLGLLRLAHSKLTADGSLVLCVPNIGHWSIVQSLLAGRWDYADEGILDKTHLRFFTFHSLCRCLNDAGFAVQQYGNTQLAHQQPSPGVQQAFRDCSAPGTDPQWNMNSYQFQLICKKI